MTNMDKEVQQINQDDMKHDIDGIDQDEIINEKKGIEESLSEFHRI